VVTETARTIVAMGRVIRGRSRSIIQLPSCFCKIRVDVKLHMTFFNREMFFFPSSFLKEIMKLSKAVRMWATLYTVRALKLSEDYTIVCYRDNINPKQPNRYFLYVLQS